MMHLQVSSLLKKWDSELKALSDAFDDPFTWNVKCSEILERLEDQIERKYRDQQIMNLL